MGRRAARAAIHEAQRTTKTRTRSLRLDSAGADRCCALGQPSCLEVCATLRGLSEISSHEARSRAPEQRSGIVRMTHPAAPETVERERVGIEPRGLNREQAARYAGCDTLSAFHDWVRRGILPGPIPGTHRWDRKAIDAALDRRSGLAPTVGPSPLQEWKSRRARDDQGRPQG